MFELNNVCFQYGNKKVLQDINLSIKEGSFLGVIGPNGSGKTTLLNLMTGYLKTSAGKIKFYNKNIEEYSIPDLARYISIVFQNADIKFPFTCLEIVMMGRTPFKNKLKELSKKDMEIIYRCMELTDTLHFANRLITEVSGGERQRINFARALAQSPKVLMLDEAFSNMDIYYSIKLLNILEKLVKKEGLTVIMVMHDLNLVNAFCSSVAMLEKGGLVAYGTTEEVMKPELIFSLFKVKVTKLGKRCLAVLPEL